MFAKRLNKVYPVNTPQERKAYLSRGYDICDDDGGIIEHNPQKTVPYAEYERVRKESEALRTKLAFYQPEGDADPLEAMDAADLKKYAADNGINIGTASSKSGILKKIREARANPELPEDAPEIPKTLRSSDDAPKMGAGAAQQE